MNDHSNAVRWSVDGGLGTIRLSRGRGNAIDDSILDGLMAAFRAAESDPAVRGVLLTADGKLFCPGLDIRALVDLDRPAMDRFMTRFGNCVLRMYTFRKPVVAALQGHALAGGLILALTADWRVLQDGAMVGLNELKVGVPLPFGVTMILRDAIVGPRLEEVALFGRNYRGADAASSGLVHEVVPADGFDDHCRERLREMTTKDLGALAVTKSYLRSATVERIRAHDDAYRTEFLDCWFSEGTRERVEELARQLQGGGRGDGG